MNFTYSRQHLSGRERLLERLLEILPGATSWSLLIGMTALSFSKPILAAALIIAFNLYWFLRLCYVTLFLVFSYIRLSLERDTDWMAKLSAVDREGSPETPSSEAIYHLVVIPVAKESAEVVEPGIAGLASSHFPPQKILVIIALEQRAGEAIRKGLSEIREKYAKHFFDFLIILHPDGLPGEARVKGANAACAAKAAAAYFEERKIPFERVILSCFDADTVASPDYFSCLTYHFLRCPDRNRASFQPIPVYHNNIWEAPGFARVLDIGSSFFQMIEATNPEKLVTFSSHSMSFKALVDIGYWPVDIISDDSAIFWKAYLHYEGDYRVIPLYVTISMDVVHAGSWWKTIRSVYKQKRRWAWGVENFPIVIRGFLKAKKIPLSKKIRHAVKLFESHVAWATWAFLLTFIGWLPVLFAGREFSSTVLYYTTPRITGILFHLASLSLATTVVLSLSLLPKKKIRYSRLKRVGHALEWCLVPFVVTFLSALPALDAQTRLLFGNYMEFWVTDKKR